MRYRKKMVLVVAGLLASSAGVAGQIQLEPQQPPRVPVVGPLLPEEDGLRAKMVLDTLEVDFGRILDDVNTEFREITFRNEGDASLIIHDLRASCGCTVGELDKREYAPGETGVLRIQFRPQGKRNLVRQTVTITTNDESLPNAQARIDVTAFVMPIVSVDPTMVNLGMLRRGEFVSSFFSVTGLAEDFDIVTVDVIGNDSLSVEVLGRERVSSDQGRAGWKIDLEALCDGTAKPGMMRGTIRVRTNDPRRESVMVTVTGQVLGDIAVSQPRISLGSLTMGEIVTPTIRVETRSGVVFTIKGFDEQSNLGEPIKWDIVPVGGEEPASAYEVTLTVRAPSTPGMIRATVIMKTDMPDEERVQLMVFGMVPPEGMDDRSGLRERAGRGGEQAPGKQVPSPKKKNDK